jgi:hypothetical protein
LLGEILVRRGGQAAAALSGRQGVGGKNDPASRGAPGPFPSGKLVRIRTQARQLFSGPSHSS